MDADDPGAVDIWKPVEVPFGRAQGAAAEAVSKHQAAAAAAPLFAAEDNGDEENELYFLQLPTELPPVVAERLRSGRQGSVGLETLKREQKAVAAAAAAAAGGPASGGMGASFSSSSSSSSASLASAAAATPGTAGASPSPSSPSTPAALGTCRISAGQGGHLQGALGEITAGHLGVIKVHQSGKVVLHLGDSQYTLSPGVRCGFAQQVVSVHHGPAADLDGLGAAAKPSADDPLPTPAAAMDVEGEGGAGSGAAAGATEEEPKSYTVLGPITKRCVGMPVMDAE